MASRDASREIGIVRTHDAKYDAGASLTMGGSGGIGDGGMTQRHEEDEVDKGICTIDEMFGEM